jgi:hypothetical protein
MFVETENLKFLDIYSFQGAFVRTAVILTLLPLNFNGYPANAIAQNLC